MNHDTVNLKRTKEWVDFDQALFGIGRELGIFAQEYQYIPNIKSVLWTKNPVNDCLTRIAGELVQIGYLEYDHDSLRYRRKEGFSLLGNCDRSG